MDAMRTGAYLAMLRKTRGATQQEIAEQLGVSNKTVSKWESGGGLPDITVLPALAELYGVTADDILAGETLTDRRRGALAEETAAQRKRLLARLRMRFDVCLVPALALAALAAVRLQYVSRIALLASVTVAWMGHILVAHPVRYGGVEVDEALWLNLYRKLMAAGALQWYAFLRLSRIGSIGLADAVSSGEWRAMAVLAMRAGVFCLGTLVIWGALQWRLRRLAGKGVWIIPAWVMLWGCWAAVFLAAWLLADGAYQQTVEAWLSRYPSWEWIDQHPALRIRRDEALAPLLLARRIVLAAGGVSGLGLLAGTVWSGLRRKKTRAPLRTHRNDDKISP